MFNKLLVKIAEESNIFVIILHASRLKYIHNVATTHMLPYSALDHRF
jgi:hypothetical protein